MDRYLHLHHSLHGNGPVSVLDVMLLSYMRRKMKFVIPPSEPGSNNTSRSLFALSEPLVCMNVIRLLDHILKAFEIGYTSLDKKERSLYDKLHMFQTSTEFIEAVKAGNVEEAARLLEQNPRIIRAREGKGRNESGPHIATTNKDYKMLELLKSQKFVSFNLNDIDNETPIFEAIHQKDLKLVKYLVEECGADIEHREIQDRTPLYHSCSVGCLDISEFLISKGADINAKTKIGRTCLAKSCWNGHHEIVKFLLQYEQADTETQDNQGRTALHMAVWGQYGGRLRKKASLNPTDSPECALLLLQRGANPNCVDFYKVPPLGTACGTGGARCIEMLVKYGADINMLDEHQTTCLHACFFRGNEDCMIELLKHKPNASLRQKNGFLPIDSLFRDDMENMLESILYNEEVK